MAVVPTGVITSQPGVINAPEREWSTGICGCCEDCKSCCCTFFFPWCYLCCCVSKKMHEHCCTPIFMPLSVVTAYRVKVRTKHNIEGSVLCDCCYSHWCWPCSICQIARELKYVKKHPV